MRTVSDAIADALVDRGIAMCFGVVGGGNVRLWSAISERMPIICTHHEQAAAQAATYYYRVCGRLAPVLVTSGAGSANAITGVMAAYMDSIPLLVLAGNETAADLTAHELGHGRLAGFQGYQSHDVAKPFCKWSGALWPGDPATDVLRAVMATIKRLRPGPGWLMVPRDVQGAPYASR